MLQQSLGAELLQIFRFERVGETLLQIESILSYYCLIYYVKKLNKTL